MKRKIFAVFFSAAICLFSFSSCGSSESSPDIDIQGIKDDITEQDEMPSVSGGMVCVSSHDIVKTCSRDQTRRIRMPP